MRSAALAFRSRCNLCYPPETHFVRHVSRSRAHPSHFARPSSISISTSLLSTIGFVSHSGRPISAEVETQYGIASFEERNAAHAGRRATGNRYLLAARDGQPVNGKFPAILERTPYNKDGGVPDSSGHIPPSPSDYLVPRGYVVVVQDVRGRYKSEGHWQGVKNDPDDGFDTAKWIGSQRWSNGKIGTIGTSYGGRYSTCIGARERTFRRSNDSDRCHVELRSLRSAS